MTEDDGVELFRQEGEEFRSIRLGVHASGLRLSGHDMGRSAKQVWGGRDYEFWVDIPAGAMRKLAFVLLRERFMGREHAVDELHAFCEKHAIEHHFGTWS